jgi:hypothetical protein
MRYFRSLAVAAAAAALAVAGVAVSASAATPGCTAVLGNACGSWNAEVPGQPDLDVTGGASQPGAGIIVFTRTSRDRAEDFAVQAVAAGSTPKYGVAGVAPAGAVRIQFTPGGVASDLCLSTVNPDGHTGMQLRPCDNAAGQYNEYQTFVQHAAACDGTCFTFAEVIHGLVITDPRGSGSIGVLGHRVHVITAVSTGASGQIWGQNGA